MTALERAAIRWAKARLRYHEMVLPGRRVSATDEEELAERQAEDIEASVDLLRHAIKHMRPRKKGAK